MSGNYTQAAGSTLTLEANPTTASEFVVSGSASLAGTLALTFDAGSYTVGTEYTLLTAAGGVTGTFGTLTESGAATGTSLELTYDANAVELTLAPPPVCNGSPVLDCEIAQNTTSSWSTQITATTLDLNTQNPNSGTLVLTTANNEQTGNNVIAGTLSVSAAGDLGSASGALTLGGTQTGGGATNGTLLTTTGLTWAGSLTTAGAGGTVLVGTGQTTTLSGTVTDAAGLTVGNDGNLGALALSGVVSGAGGITVGGGTLTLSNANTYTGGTTVTAGTVSVSADNNLGGAGAVTLNGGTLATTGTFTSARAVTVGAGGGTFVPSSGTTLTLSGTLSGTGAEALTGAGTVLLTGTAGGATGTFTVTSGTLEVGSAATPGVTYGGNVAVQTGATLAGHGTVSGNVTNGGTVSPGGSVGTLTVSGNYVQGAGDTLAIEANPSTASELVVGGSATLGGTLALTFDAGTYAATEYTLLTASGGVTGTFGSVTQSGASLGSLMTLVTYQANAVDLTLLATEGCSSNGSGTTYCDVPNGDSFTYNAAITDPNLLVNTISPDTGTLTLGGTNAQTHTTIAAGEVKVSSAANLGGAGAGLTLTLGGTQTGGGAAFGNLLETTGFTWNGSVATAGTGGDLSAGSGQSATFTGAVNNAAGLDVGTNGAGTRDAVRGHQRGGRGHGEWRRDADPVRDQHVYGRDGNVVWDARGERGREPRGGGDAAVARRRAAGDAGYDGDVHVGAEHHARDATAT